MKFGCSERNIYYSVNIVLFFCKPTGTKAPLAFPTPVTFHKPLAILTFSCIIYQDEKKVNMVTVSNGADIREEVLYEIAGPRMALCTSFQDMVAKVEKIAGLACDIPE